MFSCDRPRFSRKHIRAQLVIETGKFNVLTASSTEKAIETLRKYSALDGVVLDSKVRGMPCEELVSALKSIKPSIPVIAVCGPGDHPYDNADYQLETFEPRVLLELLRTLLPAESAAIQKHEEDLHHEQ